MIALNIDKPQTCTVCPMYNYKSDYCQACGQTCRYKWTLSDNFTEKDRESYIDQICPIIVIGDEYYDDIILNALKTIKVGDIVDYVGSPDSSRHGKCKIEGYCFGRTGFDVLFLETNFRDSLYYSEVKKEQ